MDEERMKALNDFIKNLSEGERQTELEYLKGNIGKN